MTNNDNVLRQGSYYNDIYEGSKGLNKDSILFRLVEQRLNIDYERQQDKDYVEPSPYALGTFDENTGMPLQPKMNEMYRKVLSKSVSILILEGGVRGGKDVFGLDLYSKVLINSVEENHLALGSSLEHAIMTIMLSNKFGLKHRIPNGRFERLSSEGAGNRGVFTFHNIYGELRKVHFYGNAKHNDHTKFQGFTIGTTYINEGINQHMNGIIEAQNRMSTSKDGGLMIITQNPVGTQHKLYTEFEKGLLLSNDEIKFIKDVQSNPDVITKWLEFNTKEKIKRKKVINEFVKLKLKQLNKTSLKEIKGTIHEQSINRDIHHLENQLKYGVSEKQIDGSTIHEEGIYSKPLKDFIDIPEELNCEYSKVKNASMYKIMTWSNNYDNPNGVINGYNYAYYHFTMRDNLAMTEMQILEEESKYDKTTAKYKQRFLGERVSSDGLAFPEFSEDNILTRPVEHYEQNPNTVRVIAIDPGASHSTGIVDAEINYETGEIFVLGALKLDLKNEDKKRRNFSELDIAIWEVIRSRKNRELPNMLLIDPSNPFLIGHYAMQGFNAIAADNSRATADSKEIKYGDKTVKKGMKGLDLIKSGFVRRKFWVHENATDLISELEGLTMIFNETTGQEDTIKIGDDVYDAFRYICNSSGIDSYDWERLDFINEFEEKELRENERTQDSGRDLDRGQASFQEIANRLGKERGFQKQLKGKGSSKISIYDRWFN